jgi:aspartate ammonia-lyase
MPRQERDSLGEVPLPDSAYYGVQTARALANFPVSGSGPEPELVRAYCLVKKAAAAVNVELGVLDRERGDAIVRAADEVLTGGLADQFVVDPFQAGAGTSFNMNVNEVVANRALELLGRPKGDYAFLSPNDHVNRSQSSNDTYPTACHLAVISAADRLPGVLADLARTLRGKAGEFADISKVGRTHLMDALPVRLGDEFGAWAGAVERAAVRVGQRREDLLEIAIGGTAVGSGDNAPTGYRALVVAKLSELTGLRLRPARDSFEALQSRAQMAAFSSALKELALELGRIANDLRLLGSGPVAGFGEVTLPAVQPGSSIMPGKVNPSLPECLNMICYQVVGNDLTVSLAAQAGQLELNVFAPVMVHNVLGSLRLLFNFLPVFTTECVAGIRADSERCQAYLALNPSLATLLAPRIGYVEAAALAQESARTRRPVRDLAVEKGLVTAEEARTLFRSSGPRPRSLD